MVQINYKDCIEVNPEIRFGKLLLKRTRITVYDVLQWFASGMSYKEIIADFPRLDQRKILTCLAYAANSFRNIGIDAMHRVTFCQNIPPTAPNTFPNPQPAHNQFQQPPQSHLCVPLSVCRFQKDRAGRLL